MRPRILSTVACGLVVASLAPAAYGDEPRRDEKAADVLFQSAKAALERGDLGTACAQFAESQRLDPAAGTLLNLGECEERSGKVATAMGHLKEARALLAPGDYRIPFADARMAGLARRIPHLTLRLAEPYGPGTKVTCDDRELPKAAVEQPLSLDPGPHVCVIQVPGRGDGRAEATLKESDSVTLDLKLAGAVTPTPVVQPPPDVHAGAAPAPEPPRAAPPAGEGSRGGTQRIAGIAVGGAGAVGLAVGAILGLVAKGTYDGAVTNYCKSGPASCTQPGVNGGQSAHDQATASTVAFIAGGALLAGGGLLYFTAPRTGRVAIAPTVGSNGAGFALSGAW